MAFPKISEFHRLESKNKTQVPMWTNFTYVCVETEFHLNTLFSSKSEICKDEYFSIRQNNHLR